MGGLHLARLAEESVERAGDYPRLLFEDRWYGSVELLERSQRMATGLRELGVGPGDRVVVTMANCAEVSVAYYAIWRAGAVVTPATFLLAPEDLRHLVADAEASAVITTPEFVDKVTQAVAGLECVRAVISTQGGDGVVGLATLEAHDPGAIVERDDHDLAALLYTGGTTGRAKGVMLSHANLHFTGRSAQQSGHVEGVNKGLMTLPMSHAYGLLVTLAALHSPERPVTVMLRWFAPAQFLELIQAHELQLTAVVPSMLQILLAEPLEEYDLTSLRYVGSGGSPLSPDVEEEFRRRVPSVSIRQGYGLTETAALLTTNPAGREKPGSVGLPVPGTEIVIRDEDGRSLPPGEPGEVCSRSPGVMQGYWRSPDTTAGALRDGWLQTGDIGYLDEDGYLFIVDRKKDLIIRGGFNVYPRDVEDALVEHPDVRMAGVVGKPDPVHGEEVVAFVALRPEADVSPDALIEWARQHIGGYKYPRQLHLIDALPLTPVGKIDRKNLRARITA